MIFQKSLPKKDPIDSASCNERVIFLLLQATGVTALEKVKFSWVKIVVTANWN